MNGINIAVSPSSFAEGDPAALAMLENAGVVVSMNPYKRKLTEEEAIAFLEKAEGLIAGVEPLTRRVLQSAKKLKAIARVGIGMSNIDMQAAGELNIKLSNTPDGPTQAVAEMTLCSLLALARGLVDFNRQVHQGAWKKAIGLGLEDTNVLIIGFGRIGRRFSELLAPFRSKILVYDPHLDATGIPVHCKLVSLEEGLKNADVISLHAAGEDTLLTNRHFSQMKKGVFILNSSRGKLIDESALTDALDSKKVAGAWLDVFEQEPYTGKLVSYENVLLTPHMSTYTRQCRLSMEVNSVKNLFRDMGIKC